MQDSEGQTPLHYACICEHQGVIDYLVSQGANVHEKDNSDQSPNDMCEELLARAIARINVKS